LNHKKIEKTYSTVLFALSLSACAAETDNSWGLSGLRVNELPDRENGVNLSVKLWGLKETGVLR